MSKGLTRDRVLLISRLSKHQLYYKPRKSVAIQRGTGGNFRLEEDAKQWREDAEITEHIRQIKHDPDTNYGYRKMTYWLRLLGYYINPKKVYRLMKESHLLMPKNKRAARNYAKYRVVIPEGPLQVLEMDIKMIWITEQRCHAYVLTVIDTFTRVVLHWVCALNMKSNQVKKAWDRVIEEHLQPADVLTKDLHVEVRNDNGPQFASKATQEYFKENSLTQVFTHPYTPQENGHVESFHNILSTSIGNRIYWSLKDLQESLVLFYENYNNMRLHGSIACLWPMLFWEMWEEGLIKRIVKEKRKIKFIPTIPYQEISGLRNLKGVSCLKHYQLDAGRVLDNEANGPETLQTTSVHQSPSVVSCYTNQQQNT